MNFLLDMGLAQSSAQYLRTQGHNAVHLRDENLQRLPDEQIIAKAIVEDRIIITHDLDFGRLVALSGKQFPSIITLRLENMQPTIVNYYLMQVFEQFSAELTAGALISVNEQVIRVRLLPIT